MASRLVDNRRVSLATALDELAPNYEELSVATGYWDLPGMQLVFDRIDDYKKIRIVLGQEPLPPRYARQLDIFDLDGMFPEREIADGLNSLDFEPTLRDLVVRIKALIAEGRLEVRVFRGGFLHAKSYIFGTYDSTNAVGIIGSSNFTRAGLTTNIELNALESDERIVQFKPLNEAATHGHLSWFDEIWDDPSTEVWNGKFTKLLEASPVGDTAFSRYAMYIKTLQELYSDELVAESELSQDTEQVLFEFQQRNARLLLAKLEKHGLAMLADSVGLGKTITAGAVIRHYIEENDARRVYVIAPASLTFQWREDLAKVHGLYQGFEIISMQDIGRIRRERLIDKYAGVDLFVIDEAHNLRSGSGSRHDELLEWFSDNQESHVLLLTATPINNSLSDFVNQIQLASKGRLESFPVVYPTSKKAEVIDFYEAVGRLSKEITEAEKKGDKPDYAKVNRVMQQGLRRFLVRTTRKGIEREFGGIKDSKGKLQKFPTSHVVPAPYSFDPSLTEHIDARLRDSLDIFRGWDPTQISIPWLLAQTQRAQHPLDILTEEAFSARDVQPNAFSRVFQAILLLGFAPYKTDIYQRRFYAKTPDEIRAFSLSSEDSMRVHSQLSVHNMLRVTLLKRLESSHYALRRSLENYQGKLAEFSAFLDQGFIIRLKDVAELRGIYGDDLDALALGDSSGAESADPVLIPIDETVHNIEALKRDVASDQAIVAVLIDLCEMLGETDDKLQAFSKLVEEIVAKRESGEKILIFSYYADTIDYLQSILPSISNLPDFSTKAAFTSGKTKAQIEDLARRFSPKSKGGAEITSREELNYLFSTDVLSEGQNLQDCGVLVNFDLHWNPVRMIQRNGRINRLGSSHDAVFIHNMHPEINLDEYLALVARLQRKIDRIRYTVGTDQSVLGEEANPIEFIDDVEATRSESALLDLYDPETADAALDQLDDDDDLLSEDEFILDLRAFVRDASEDEKAALDRIPEGKWGYLPDHSARDIGDVQALALVRVTGTVVGSDEALSNHIFVTTTDSWGPVETIDALRALRVPPSDSKPLPDTIKLDRTQISKRSRQVAKSHVGLGTVSSRVTPSTRRALDAISRQAPSLEFHHALERITTKQDQKDAKRLVELTNREVKAHGVILDGTLLKLSNFSERMQKKKLAERLIDENGVRGILFYARK